MSYIHVEIFEYCPKPKTFKIIVLRCTGYVRMLDTPTRVGAGSYTNTLRGILYEP